MPTRTIGLLIEASGGPGVLHQTTGVIAKHEGDITLVEILERGPAEARLYLEVELPGEADPLLDELRGTSVVRSVRTVDTFQRIYGKRIIIMGGGAQVGQVAIGAISEADRHNIRGEHISVDTIPLVGEQTLAKAVREVREQGLLVVSLNMAGSVPDAADIVVTDPVQAGVMAVMAVADTALFQSSRLKRRVF